MGRESIYYSDLPSIDEDGFRFYRIRIAVVPAGSTFTLPNYSEVPGWLEDPSVTSAYIRLPAGSLGMPEFEESGYEDIARGWTEAAAASIEVDFRKLIGSVAIGQFAGYLRTNVFDNAGTLWGQTIISRNTWLIYTDRGDSTLDPADFYLLFAGQQQVTEEKEGRMVPRLHSMQKIELVDMVFASMTTLLMGTVCATMADEPIAPPPQRYCFSSIYQDGGADPAWDWYYYSHGQDANTAAKWYRRKDLYLWIQEGLRLMYAALMRTDPDTTVLAFKGGAEATMGVAQPTDHLTFYRRTTSANNERGAALAEDDAWFIGVVLKADDFTTVLGGLLVNPQDTSSNDTSNSLYRYKTAWDYLKPAVEGSVCKARIAQLGHGHAEIWFEAPLAGAPVTPDSSGGTHPSGWREMDLSMFMHPDDEPPAYPYTEGSGATPNIQVAPIEAWPGDEEGIEVRRSLVSDTGENLDVIWNNWPAITDNPLKGNLPTGAEGGGSEHLEAINGVGESAGVATPEYPMWALYSFEPNILRDDLLAPVIVHQDVTINPGIGSAITYSTHPDLPGPGLLFDDDWRVQFWVPLRSVLRSVQQGGGLPWALAQFFTENAAGRFGWTGLTLWELEMLLSEITPQDIGTRARMLATGGNYTSAYLDPASALNDLPVAGIILAMQPLIATNRIVVKFHGMLT